MKVKTFIASVMLSVAVAFPCSALEADLVAVEKQIYADFKKEVAPENIITVEQFKSIVDEVNAGKRNAYILDLRMAEEFYTFHIEGADNIHAGHVYTIPKNIKDPNAEIYIFCRTSHRAYYVAHLMTKYGYTNVKILEGGMVSWLKAEYPVVNQYMGRFVAKYADFKKDYNKDFRDKNYRVREFHPN
ncbi:MAG: hypothetical protein GQ559_09940 [Desulfobulbaceae bacterium]|nr:hypothetical protein [Desulfobulbaceae bacterium]